MKRCRKCQRQRKLKQFYKNVDATDGYSSWCRECQAYKRRTTSNRDALPNYGDAYLHALVDKLGYRPKEPDLMHDFAERKAS